MNMIVRILRNIRRVRLGFTDDMDKADLIILNTCSIRENAHNKAFGLLGRIKHLKETKKDLKVGLCGCMAQEEIVVNTIINKYPFVNFVIVLITFTSYLLF